MRRPLLGLLFLLSGAAALCYEVAWTRHLVLVFGNTTRAVALLLGAYMLGLALGSEVGGRIADRTKRPAALYGLFELGIAAFALAFPWLVDAVRAVYLGIGTSAPPVLFALAFLLLVIPTFCMGTTLPLLARATVDDASKTGRDVGFLYAMNIVGAVIGAAGTGFVLMESQGVLGATRVAAAVNAAVGVVGWLAFRGAGAGAATKAHDEGDVAGTCAGAAGCAPTGGAASLQGADRARAPVGETHIDDPAARLRRAALLAAFASGFVGLAAQVAWTRLLTFFLNGFTWTFSAILSTFLAGLALGGWVFGRMATSSRDPGRLLVRLLLAVAVAAAAVLWALGRHEAVTREIWTVAGTLANDPHDVGPRHRWMLILSSAVVLFVPAFVMGGVFPVATSLWQRGLSDLGARVGRLYAVNTIGCVLGSLVAGFVLQPLVGPARAASFIAYAALGLAFAVAWTGRIRVPVAGLVAALAVVAIDRAAEPSKPWLLRSHVFSGDRAREVELLEERHGQVCTVSVVENTRDRYRLLYTDEFQAAGTRPEYRYMRMLAHLPVALARDPSRALVVCFGTGTTAGSVSAHSVVKSLDIVEISQEVLEVADRFADVNRGVLQGAGRSDLDVRVHVDDGRHFVQRSDERWGVISLEPLMPYTPAAIHFYTRDFYEICASRLAPGGLVCQWIPLQAMSGTDFPKLVAAFVAVFPDSAMFFVDGAVALIGGPDGVDLSFAQVQRRFADPAVAADLRSIGFADAARALATFVSGGEALRDFVKGVEPVTDERPVLEFHPIPPNTALPWLLQNLVHMQELRARWERLPVTFDETRPDGDRARNDLALALHSGNRVLEGMVALEASSFSRRAGRDREFVENFQIAREALAQAVALDPGNQTARQQWESVEREWQSLLGAGALRDGDAAKAERHFLRALEFRAESQADVVWTRLAEARNRAGKAEAALEAACEATRLFPGGLEARAERAFARSALGDLNGASEDYFRALRGSDDLTLLSRRLVPDADRARTARPWPPVPAASDLRPAAERIQAALAGGETDGTKIPPRLRLRLLAADLGDAFDAAFVRELAGPPATPDDGEALRNVATLRLAAPVGAPATFRAWLAAGRPAVHETAAEGLVEIDAAAAAALLAAPSQLSRTATVALARAAARSSDRRLVRPLIELLRHRDAEVRKAAHRSLFALGRGEAPRLGDLDTSDPDASAYRRAVFDVESWWAREQEKR